MHRLILLFSVFFLSSLFGYGGRINQPVDGVGRCPNGNYPAAQCEDLRTLAYKIGCIDDEDLAALRRYGAFPSCSIIGPEYMRTKRPIDMMISWCPCGCFAPDTMIGAISKSRPFLTEATAGEIASNKDDFLLNHLSNDSTLSYIKDDYTPIRIVSKGPEELPLYVIHTDEGKVLKVTSRHPVLLHDGQMVMASQLKKGDFLVNKMAMPVRITDITREKLTEDVVNFSTDVKEDSLKNHIIFAEGYLVGDQYWQSSLESEFNRVVIRK